MNPADITRIPLVGIHSSNLEIYILIECLKYFGYQKNMNHENTASIE